MFLPIKRTSIFPTAGLTEQQFSQSNMRRKIRRFPSRVHHQDPARGCFRFPPHGMSFPPCFVCKVRMSGDIQNLHRVVKPPYYNLHMYIYIYSQLIVTHHRIAIYPIYRCETSMWLCFECRVPHGSARQYG